MHFYCYWKKFPPTILKGILGIGEAEEKKGTRKEEHNGKEQIMVRRGAKILDRTLNQVQDGEDDSAEWTNGTEIHAWNTKSRWHYDEFEEEIRSTLVRDIEMWQFRDEKRIVLDE